MNWILIVFITPNDTNTDLCHNSTNHTKKKKNDSTLGFDEWGITDRERLANVVPDLYKFRVTEADTVLFARVPSEKERKNSGGDPNPVVYHNQMIGFSKLLSDPLLLLIKLYGTIHQHL